MLDWALAVEVASSARKATTETEENRGMHRCAAGGARRQRDVRFEGVEGEVSRDGSES